MVHFSYNPRQTFVRPPPYGSLVRVHASQAGRGFAPAILFEVFTKSAKAVTDQNVIFRHFGNAYRCYATGFLVDAFYLKVQDSHNGKFYKFSKIFMAFWSSG